MFKFKNFNFFNKTLKDISKYLGLHNLMGMFFQQSNSLQYINPLRLLKFKITYF